MNQAAAGRRQARDRSSRWGQTPAKWVKLSLLIAALAIGGALAVQRYAGAQTLQVTYGAAGVQTVKYGSVLLEDLGQFPADSFHIWHMKMTDLSGNVLTGGEYVWGENNNGKQWDAASQTWTYSFVWGSIAVHFVQSTNELSISVVETNNADSGVILDGASIFPLALHFPVLPKGFGNPTYPQLSDNTTAPSPLAADYRSGLAATVAHSSYPLYSGFMPTAQANAYTALVSSTTPDGVAPFQTQVDRPVRPGATDRYTVSLRFAASGTPLTSIAGDIYRAWDAEWPAVLNWPDHRIIGTAYLASSPTGSPSQPGGYPNNPRRYFNDSNASDFDIRTSAGLQLFQQRILAQAAAITQNLQQLNAQGAITWDIEGEQYPQNTSYVCSPDQIATAAPEMESVVQDTASPYVGMKLDDAYFKIIRDAGFRVGVCVRPQQFTIKSNGTAGQAYLAGDQPVAQQLIGKMRYAHDRWGATLFYLDSTVDSIGGVLEASIFQQAAAALPDSLLMPEESSPKHYAYTAPFKNFLFNGQTGTDSGVYGYYPKAFSATLINDVDATKLQAAEAQLTESVRHGDILMVHADYWQANNNTVEQIYAAAEAGSNVKR